MKYSEEDKARAKEALKDLKPGDVVYTEIVSVSRSGMTRHIKPIIIRDNQPNWIGHYVAALLDERLDKEGGVIVTGAGMDMGFNLVYRLSYRLFPDGFGIKGEASLYPQGVTPATKAEADNLRSKGVKFHSRNGDDLGWDKDGGYALKQRWL